MRCEAKHIGWLLSGVLMLLLSACSSSETEPQMEEQPTVITFYVYPSDSPMPTRAGNDLVNTIAHENDIKSLQIWVFTHDDGKLVGYLSPTVMPTAEGTVYQMEVSKEFANAATKPNVDVYVAANTAAAGLSFNGATTRADLESAKIGTNYFGVSSLYTTINTNEGLPMSGVLLNQPVVGQNPVLRIGKYDNMAKVQLQRAVSKVRFVFCMQQGTDPSETPTITGITLNGENFPVEEYLFLGSDTNPYRIGETYESSAATLLPSTAFPNLITPQECDDPSKYIYDSQIFTTAQAYEDKIDEGVNGTASDPNHKELSQVGPFYFRETNKKISGIISYQVGSETRPAKAFSMVAENGFTRNHSWIVYVYYGADGLDVLTVYVKEWTLATQDHSVYNW